MGKIVDNRYQIIEKIGAGGMGAVYLAEDIRLRRKVAMKRLAMMGMPMNIELFIKRFEREALEMASFQHTNIVSVYDYGQDDEGVYLVLEYMPGGALTDRLKRSKIPVSKAVKILLPLTEALQAIHDRSRVHRDIKPANILFDAYGKPKLADFGVVKLMEQESGSTLTAAGQAVGTPAYMAPELISGETSHYVDQYALTVVFYEMVTGKRPFNGRTPMETLTMQRYSPLPDPAEINPNLPPWVCSVLKQGLEKDPALRFSSMRSFADALRKQGGRGYQEEYTAPASKQFSKTQIVPQKIEQADQSPITPSIPSKESSAKPIEKQPVPEKHTKSKPEPRKKTIRKKKHLPKWLPWAGVGMLGITIMGGLVFWIFGLINDLKIQPDPTQASAALQATVTSVPEPTETATNLPDASATPTPKPTHTPVPTPTYVVVSSMREIDQMEMVYVDAGQFIMGSDEGDPDEQPVHEVYLDSFWIDKYEVTNAQYEACVDAYVCTPPTRDRSYLHQNYYGTRTYDNYPVLYVNWFQAKNYCAWVGGRLPTEAEWEKAARGIRAFQFPWGDDPINCQLANYGGFNGCVGDTKFVGGYPAGASQYGAMDMVGNISEWVSDWYDENYYTGSPAENPQGPEEGELRILRGGSHLNEKDDIRVTNRYPMHSDEFEYPDFYTAGFRCVMDE